MTQKIYTILGATGHIGHLIAEDLLKRGHIVRAIGRDTRKLHQLELKGAIPIYAELTDSAKLTEAFRDSYAVFTMLPPIMEDLLTIQDRIGEGICKAIQDAGVTRVVNLSSIGAELAEGTGPVKGLHAQEERLNALQNLHFLVHLRPHYFMENLLEFLPMIPEGVIRSPIRANFAFPMVATRDVGWKAVGFLENTAPELRQVFDFVGPKEVSMQNVVDTFADCFDCPNLRYEQISYEQAKLLMINSGVPSDTADVMIEMETGFNNGLFRPTQELTLEHHGATPLDTFVEMISYRSYAKAA